MSNYGGPSYGEIKASMLGDESVLTRVGDSMSERMGSVTTALRHLGDELKTNNERLHLLAEYIEPMLLPEYEKAEASPVTSESAAKDRVSPMAETIAEYTRALRHQGRRIQEIIERIDV